MSPTIKAALTPGSIGFLVLCFAVWLVLKYVWPRKRRLGRAWLFLVGGAYLVLGLPCVANAIVDRLPLVPAAGAASLRAVDTLVVLDGDNRVGRAREATRVYAAAQPAVVVVLGQVWIQDELVAAGLPENRFTRSSSSHTTRTQMTWMQDFAARRPNARIALIASRLQMPRVAALAKAAGLELTLVPSPIDAEPPTTGAWQFVPMYIALRASRDALYEHAALVYYRWRGWIGK